MLPTVRNLFADLPTASAGEIFDELLTSTTLRIERIASLGHATPIGEWYDQEGAEWVALLRGDAELIFEEGARLILRAGDSLLIPPRRRHRVERTSADALWLGVHYQL